MTFPVLEAPVIESAPAQEEDPEREAAAPHPTPLVAVGGCAACDGSGLWRGIDGFVFVCQHCCFEIT